MKKVIISLAVLFSFGTGFYLASNHFFVDNVKTADCPCTPDCQPGDAWCTCKYWRLENPNDG